MSEQPEQGTPDSLSDTGAFNIVVGLGVGAAGFWALSMSQDAFWGGMACIASGLFCIYMGIKRILKAQSMRGK